VTALTGPVLTAAEMRAAELACGIPLDALMERAGAALAQAAWRFGNGAPTLVLCGPGNNGGDGYVAARLLASKGVAVSVAAIGEPKTPLARAARDRWTGVTTALAEAQAAPVIIDAVFGTGLSRALSDDVGTALWTVYALTDLIIAADMPSGVGTDDGADFGAIPADITVALGALKPAHLLQPAAAKCGRIIVADIGIDPESCGSLDCNAIPMLTAPAPTDHKYTRGMVAIVAGAMPGAATLSVTAAAHLAGYAVLCGDADAPAAVVHRAFDAVIADPKLRAMLIGPGLHDTSESRAKLDAAIGSAVPLVIDAGALALMSPKGLRRSAATVITPHEGEFVRLFGALPGSKIDRARNAAIMSDCVVILKGSDTVIAAPDGRVTLCPPPSTWLATAGSGDVLAGIIVAVLARKPEAYEAARAAVWLHSEAARRAGVAFIADDLATHLPGAIARTLW
jgi:ADP-dependent NAD(P)H-hydrate dehydratase / NAD(P)H-hydrate epimerase